MALIKDAAHAAETERRAAMPSPEHTARRGIVAGRYMGLSERQAALMVMAASTAAAVSAEEDGCTNTSWLHYIHAEAQRIYLKHVQNVPLPWQCERCLCLFERPGMHHEPCRP